MRTFLKLGSLALTASLTLAFGCGGDDDGDSDSASSSGGSGGSTSGGGSGGSTSGGGSGGSTSGGGSGGTTTTGGGGTTTTGGGGTGGDPGVEMAPYANDDCTAEDGPNADVTGSGIGAFADADDWMDGWTNFSTNSSGVDCESPTDFPATGADRTLTAADSPYALDDVVYVADGETLTIEPGVVVCGTGSGSLVVSRGGTIMAEGTADEPIVFTSAQAEGSKAPGQWGGVILLGNGENFNTEDLIEGLADDPANYHGGDDDADSSGSLAYVRIEFGGTDLGDGNEINGLTMGSIGSGTSIHHIQVNTTLDDCFEWFGGAADAHHLVCNNAGDDMFDADQGFRGTLSELFGRQVTPLSSDPNGFEMDSSNAGNTPTTTITAENSTLCGTGEPETDLNYGMVLRENLEGAFSNIVISGFAAGVDVRDDAGTASDPKVSITGSMMFDAEVHTIAYDEGDTCPDEAAADCDDDMGFDERAWFTDDDTNMAYDPE